MRRSIATRPITPPSTTVLARFFSRSPDLFLVVDDQGWILSANDAFLALAPRWRPGTSFLDAHADAARTRLQMALLSPKAGKAVAAELRVVGASPSWMSLEYRLFPLDPGVLGVIGRRAARTVRRRQPASRQGADGHDPLSTPVARPTRGRSSGESFPVRLADAWNDAVRRGEPLSCVVLRVEGLERVRREEGREVADALRKAVGLRLKSLLREHEAPAYYGEDRFAFVVSRRDEEHARQLGRTAAREFATTRFAVCGGIHRLSLRVGCASRSDGDASSETMLHLADAEVRSTR